MVILSYSNPYQSLKFSFQIETINLGKRPLVRRRGRGGNQFRSTSTGKVGKTANYPRFPLAENHVGEIIDLVHERGREAPLSKVRFEDGSISLRGVGTVKKHNSNETSTAVSGRFTMRPATLN